MGRFVEETDRGTGRYCPNASMNFVDESMGELLFVCPHDFLGSKDLNAP
jgi:hypothetical protein